MKKFLLVSVVLALMLCFSCGVLADAAIYDYGELRDCDYYVYVATTDGGVNLREAPTVESYLIRTIPDFVQLHITQESTNGSGWGYTSFNGDYGWVSLTQVTSYFPIKNASDYVVITGSSVNLREGPYTTYGTYGTIPYGTEVYVEGTYNGWGEVVYNGQYGWISLDYTVASEDFVDVKDGTEEDDGVVEEPAADEPAVTSLDKEDDSKSVLPMIIIGMIILVIVIAAVLIIVLVVRKNK